MDFTKDIYLNTDKIYENSSLIVLYNGILSENPHSKVFLHYGYNSTWDNADELRLKRTESGLLGVLRISAGETFQFTFRDDKNNWDNNNDANYILPILEKEDKILEFGPAEITKKIKEYTEAKKEPITTLETNVCSSSEIEITTNTEPTIETVPENVAAAEIDTNTTNTIDTDTYTIAASSLPNATLVNKLSFDSDSNSFYFAKEVIKEEEKEKITAEDINNAMTDSAIGIHTQVAQDTNVATNHVTVETPDFEEEPTMLSMTVQNKKGLSTRSRFYMFRKRIKLAFMKFGKLIKTALSYDENRYY